MQPGFYASPKDIVDELMKGLRLYYWVDPMPVRLLYVEFANKVQIQMAGGKVTFGRDLGNVLGAHFEQYASPATYHTSREIDIFQGTYSILYCDVVKPRIVGDVTTPLLTTIPAKTF